MAARRRSSHNNGNNSNSFNKLNQNIKNLIDAINGLNTSVNDRNNDDRPIGRRKTKPYQTPFGEARKNMRDKYDTMKGYGDYFKALGSHMKNANGQVSKFGKFLNATGKGFSSLGKGLGKANGWLFVLSVAVDVIGKVSKAIADADKRQQDIQNRRNTLMTQRNINLSNIEAEGYVDAINTEYTRQMSKFNEVLVKQQGEQNIANQTVLANATAKIGSVIGDINQSAWDRLAAQTDIQAERQKLQLETGVVDENGNVIQKGRVQEKEERARALTDWQYRSRTAQREYQQRQELLNAEAENAKLNAEAIRNAAENPWGETINYAAGAVSGGGGITSDNVYGDTTRKYAEAYGTDGSKKGRFEDFNTTTKITAAAAAGAVNSITKQIGFDFGGITDASLTKAETTLGRDITNATNELNASIAHQDNFVKVGTAFYEKSKEAQDEIVDKTTDIKKSVIDTQTQITKMFQRMAQTVEDWAMNFQNMSFNTGIGLGITDRKQLESYSLYMNSMVTKLAHTFGMTADQVLQMQQGYTAGGRSKIMNEQDLLKQGAFSQKYLGGDIATASELANDTELFNMGVSDTVDLMSEMAKKVNKIGLDGRKYMKDMTNYLKQANKYTFKDGVKGVAEMAKWAQNVRFNMNNLPQIIEGIQSGGLENVITKAAKMQVLGGRYAMYADPLAMYYEAYNDPAALAKRFNNMTKGMGRFDSKTGNVTFGQVEQELMRAFADASGQSIEDIRAQATYNVKKNKVTGVNSNLSDEQQQALVNKAYYEDGQWKVNTIDGKSMNVSDINEENVGMVQGTTYEDNMEKGMAKLVSFTELLRGNKEGNLSELAHAITQNGKLSENMNERLAKTQEDYRASFDKYVSDISNAMGEATKVYEGAIKSLLNEHTNAESATVAAITEQGTKIVEAIEKLYQDTEYKTESTTAQQPSEKENDKISNRAENPLNYQSLTPMPADNTKVVLPPMLPHNEPFKAFPWQQTNDGVMSSNGKPMMVKASSIKPINDGVAKTHPQDSAIFAKPGGPFDTLFNGIFNRIDDVWGAITNPFGIFDSILPSEPIGKSPEILSPFANNGINEANVIGNQRNEITLKPLEIKLSGNIRLESNGQSFDIGDMIKNNPLFIRQISQMLSEEIGKSINGGRSIPQYAYLKQ